VLGLHAHLRFGLAASDEVRNLCGDGLKQRQVIGVMCARPTLKQLQHTDRSAVTEQRHVHGRGQSAFDVLSCEVQPQRCRTGEGRPDR